MNVRSSRFLRPYKPGLKSLEEMRLSRICRAMRQAAISGSVFHLWWHPHNFGADIAENMAFLRRILESYRQLADEYGMTSATDRKSVVKGKRESVRVDLGGSRVNKKKKK